MTETCCHLSRQNFEHTLGYLHLALVTYQPLSLAAVISPFRHQHCTEGNTPSLIN